MPLWLSFSSPVNTHTHLITPDSAPHLHFIMSEFNFDKVKVSLIWTDQIRLNVPFRPCVVSLGEYQAPERFWFFFSSINHELESHLNPDAIPVQCSCVVLWFTRTDSMLSNWMASPERSLGGGVRREELHSLCSTGGWEVWGRFLDHAVF